MWREREGERERENKGDWYCQIFNQDERVISGCKNGICGMCSVQ